MEIISERNLATEKTAHLPFFAFIFPVILLSVTSIFSRNLFFGMDSFIVTSGSMEPEVSSGSIIYTLPKKSYSDNDVITFRQNGSYITHRIVGVEKVGNEIFYKTKGDANSEPDFDLVNSGQILGAVHKNTPYLGSIFMFLKSPLGFAAAIVLPAIVSLALYGRRKVPQREFSL